MKVWITKYALTQGVLEKEVEQSSVTPNMVVSTANQFDCYHGEGRDWHRTPEAAADKAEEMRVFKIASLEKQIKKLKAMRFL